MFVRIYENMVMDVRDTEPIGYFPDEICRQYREYPDGTAVNKGWILQEDGTFSDIYVPDSDSVETQLKLAEQQLLAMLDLERIDAELGVNTEPGAVKMALFSTGISEKEKLKQRILELRRMRDIDPEADIM